MTEDDLADRLLDMEGHLRHTRTVALTMLRRILFGGWQIKSLDEFQGSLWWVHTGEGSMFDYPDMALDDDELALWESLRKDPTR